MKQGRGFGFVVLIVVVVVVLLLATRAWKAVMPVAAQAVKPGASAVPDHGQKGAGEAVRSGNLPDLKQMGRNTDAHTRQINDAAKGQD